MIILVKYLDVQPFQITFLYLEQLKNYKKKLYIDIQPFEITHKNAQKRFYLMLKPFDLANVNCVVFFSNGFNSN